MRNNMNARAGRYNGQGGRSNSARGGRGKGGRGYNYSGAGGGTKKGLCDQLGIHVYDYGQKNAADLVRSSWEKLVQYVGTTYGQDIGSELHTKQTIVLDEPTHSMAIIDRHALKVDVIRNSQDRILACPSSKIGCHSCTG